MSKIEKRVVVDCSIERLFTYVPEIERLPAPVRLRDERHGATV